MCCQVTVENEPLPDYSYFPWLRVTSVFEFKGAELIGCRLPIIPFGDFSWIWLELPKLRHIYKINFFFEYCKVVSRSTSWLVGFQTVYEGDFDAYVLWPLANRVYNWIVARSTVRDYTLDKFEKYIKMKWYLVHNSTIDFILKVIMLGSVCHIGYQNSILY